MAIGSMKNSSVARDGADQGLGGIVDERWCGECTARPSEGTPNGGTHVLAVYATLGQLDYFVALALQQHGQQAALRKGRGHNSLFSLSDMDNLPRFRGLCLWDLGPMPHQTMRQVKLAAQNLPSTEGALPFEYYPRPS